MPSREICEGIPVAATYRVRDGKAFMVDAEYANIPADTIARFLIEKFGYDASFKGEGAEP